MEAPLQPGAVDVEHFLKRQPHSGKTMLKCFACVLYWNYRISKKQTRFAKLAQLVPYDLYSYNAHTDIVCFNVEAVSRPSCFVSIKNDSYDTPICRSTLLRRSGPIPNENTQQFWEFPLRHSNRSLWAGVSIGQDTNAEALKNGLQPFIFNHDVA